MICRLISNSRGNLEWPKSPLFQTQRDISLSRPLCIRTESFGFAISQMMLILDLKLYCKTEPHPDMWRIRILRLALVPRIDLESLCLDNHPVIVRSTRASVILYQTLDRKARNHLRRLGLVFCIRWPIVWFESNPCGYTRPVGWLSSSWKAEIRFWCINERVLGYVASCGSVSARGVSSY